MGYHVAVARAAHLLGINRHELQKLIRQGELHTFEGRLDMDELRSHFPMLVLDEDADHERLNMLRKTAFARRVSERVVPSRDTLETQLRRARAERDVEQEKAKKYRSVIEELSKRLCVLQEEGDQTQRDLVNQINHCLLEELERAKVL